MSRRAHGRVKYTGSCIIFTRQTVASLTSTYVHRLLSTISCVLQSALLYHVLVHQMYAYVIFRFMAKWAGTPVFTFVDGLNLNV